MSKDSLHPFPAKLPLRCQIHTLIIKPRGGKKKARADQGAVRCPEEGAKACLRGKVSPRDDSGTGGDQARGTAPAKSEREGVGTSDMRGVLEMGSLVCGAPRLGQKVRDTRLKSPRFRCLLCPAGNRCFRASCCLKSCGDYSIY